MATTYSTNAEVRKTFPQVDNCFPKTKLNGASTAPASNLTVDSTDAFPATGQIAILDTSNALTTLTYTGKSTTVFFLSANTAVNFSDNAEVGTGDYQIDFFRELAKAWVDTKVTNPAIPADFKKDLEIRYVYYRALKATMDGNLHQLANGIFQDLLSFIADLKKEYPPVIRSKIAYSPLEDLSEDDKNRLLNGPSA